MSGISGPFFANVVQISGMRGGNAEFVNGFYIPTSARLFSFPVYTKYCPRANNVTTTKLCLFSEKNRYFWVVRDGTDRIIARVACRSLSPTSSLCLPEHVPSSQPWELLSTGFFAMFKKKPATRVVACDDTLLLQQMSSFVGSNGYMDSVSESIRFVDSTVQDMEAMLMQSHRQSQSQSHSPTDDEDELGSINIDIDIEDMSMDQIMEMYAQDIFNGYGALVPRDVPGGRGGGEEAGGGHVVVVSAAKCSAVDMDKVLTALADEAPDEFIDQITQLIMRQPMVAPTSRCRLDRTTFAAHLAINPTDPFNRLPLSMDMIFPDVALKIRIDDWLLSRGVVI